MTDGGKTLRVLALLENTNYVFDNRVRLHAEALAADGHRVRVICPRRNGQALRERLNGVDLHRYPAPAGGTSALSYIGEYFGSTLMITLLTLWVWARHGVDVIHAYCPPDSLFLACLLPKLAGKTIIYDLRDLSPELYETQFHRSSGVLYTLLRFFERCASRQADRVIVVNESYRHILIDRDRVRPERIEVIRYGPDISQIHPVEPDPEFGGRAPTVIAFLGNMAKQDGVEHLLRALHHLDRKFGHKDWLCILIGRATDQQGLQRLTLELGIADRTCFTGFLPCERWVPVLAAADIGVEPAPANPLNRVSTMIKLMDYMALGKPSVAYDLVENRVTGRDAVLFASPDDEVDLARQLARLIEDPELRATMGAAGLQRIQQQLAWNYQKQRLLDLYQDVKRERFAGATSGERREPLKD